MSLENKKIALIGVGPMATQHVQVLNAIEGVEIVSCASRDLEKANAFAAKHNISQARVINDVLDSPEADAIWLCVAAGAMKDVALEFDTLGLPMFLEKPVGLSLAETTHVQTELKSPHMVGLNRRFYEIIQKGRTLIEESGGLKAIEIHMPEDVLSVPDTHADITKKNWQFANSVHLIDLFRFFGGEIENVTTMNRTASDSDRSYNALVNFESHAVGHFNAQWYAPGGWRVALYGEDTNIVFQPIERGLLLKRGKDSVEILPENQDTRFKAGLYGQGIAFLNLLEKGILLEAAADMEDYRRSVDLVSALTCDNKQSAQ
jgi:predicted dehydrogenase